VTQAARAEVRGRGIEAETLAARFLEQEGLAILSRNYRTRFGEVDLVAREGTTLVFVEVRRRSWSAWGGAAGSIDARKRSRIVAAAKHYISRLATEPPCRFDVVTLQGKDGTPEWLRGAFAAC
jgi:putative endonuclease